ncbi:MAG: PilZ domain-containing protein, partial [Thermodesulfobacteriota bacterium]|nr:PilZ domain-containing protein [Thermodesulfobacteriota bacterium]
MTDSQKQPAETRGKARLQTLLKEIEDVFESASEEHQQGLLVSLEELAQPEQRRHPRRPSLIQVTLDGAHPGVATNISLGGAFIQTASSFTIGQHISVDFSLRSSDEPRRMTGEVVWRSPEGVGVKFTRLLSW